VLDYASRELLQVAYQPAHLSAELKVPQIRLWSGHFVRIEP
jgi:hypothetical protein